MSTPSWIKSIGDALRPIAQAGISIATGGLLGRSVGGTSQSPTAVAAQTSVAAQKSAGGDPDAGKGSSAFSTLLKKENLIKLGLGAGAIFLILKVFKKL